VIMFKVSTNLLNICVRFSGKSINGNAEAILKGSLCKHPMSVEQHFHQHMFLLVDVDCFSYSSAEAFLWINASIELEEIPILDHNYDVLRSVWITFLKQRRKFLAG
jgi:hypothetical protein